MTNLLSRITHIFYSKPAERKPTLGVVLSGGGSRGFAHIGVLQALEEAGIAVDHLAGASMGGVIAAAYAAGLTPQEVAEIAINNGTMRQLLRLASPGIPHNGLFRGEQLLEFFREHLHDADFADLHIPLTLVAVDLNSGQEVYLNEGPVAEAVRATVSVPGLLMPVERGNQRLVDGGLLNNMPVDVARAMGADVVLAVDVNAVAVGAPFWHSLAENRLLGSAIGGTISVLVDSLTLVIRHQSACKLRKYQPDFLIQPAIDSSVNLLSGYDRASDIIAIGYEAAQPILPSLREALSVGLYRHDHRSFPAADHSLGAQL
jgi:NTE family protein